MDNSLGFRVSHCDTELHPCGRWMLKKSKHTYASPHYPRSHQNSSICLAGPAILAQLTSADSLHLLGSVDHNSYLIKTGRTGYDNQTVKLDRTRQAVIVVKRKMSKQMPIYWKTKDILYLWPKVLIFVQQFNGFTIPQTETGSEEKKRVNWAKDKHPGAI